MRSMFSRKPKTRQRPNIDIASPTPNRVSNNAGSDGQLQTEFNQLPYEYCSPLKNTNRNAPEGIYTPRASSSSPQPDSSTRRGNGVSVTFQSTLPTQIWQASPNPSPPPCASRHPSGINRMISSVSNESVSRERKPLLHTSSDDRLLSRRSRYPADSSFDRWTTNLDMDDSDSDETNHSQLSHQSISSSGSSSDESLICQGQSNRLANDNTTNGTTDSSSSSLDMHIVVQGDCEPKGKHNCARNQVKRKRKEKEGKDTNHRKVNRSAHRLRSSSSSSSSSIDDDLEALGWDEKSIAAITNRNKHRHMLTSPVPNTLVNNSKRKQQLTKLRQRVAKEEMTKSADTCPLNLTQPSNFPQSCIMNRRMGNGSQQNTDRCLSPKYPTHVTNNNFEVAPYCTPKQNCDLLAIIVNDYIPTKEWENLYRVLSVGKGEYVCVLSRPLPSRTMYSEDNSSERKTTHICSNANTEESTWLYVRRWCIDHLVATGNPGFVPRFHCRLLSSSEIIKLWNRKPYRRMEECNHFGRMHQCTTDNAHILPQVTGQQLHLPLPINTPAVNYHSPSINSARMPFDPCNNYSRYDALHYPCLQQMPPPPPGFGSGGSLVSEVEDRDSGKGPSSGSEWGSGRCGSSNVGLDSSLIEKPCSVTGAERRIPQQSQRCRNVKSAEESQLGWSPSDLPLWTDGNEMVHDEGVYVHDSSLQSPIEKTLSNDCSLEYSARKSRQPSVSIQSPITMTTRSSYKPMLEMRSSGTLVFQARNYSETASEEVDNLATSTSSCVTISEPGENYEKGNREENSTMKDDREQALWEPYKTVVHVNENTLEKFTLV